MTDLPFRLLCKEQGAGLLCMEMVSAKAILYNNKNTESLLTIHPEEPPVSLQLFGSDPKIMSEMAKRIEERPFAILDINMGCPVPKVVRNGEGSALMKEPKLVYDIVSAVVKAIDKPVTVKIRKGFDDTCVNAVEIAKIIEEAGAAAVAVHGRTREQYYSGKADWDIIRQVKEAVSIPVIGNGDVTSPQKAEELVRQTGCDGIMIARGAEGNPWIFSEMTAYEETGEIPPRPGKEELREMMADGMTDELVRYAVDIACGRNIRTWSYVRGILDRWICGEIHTLAAAKEESRGKSDAKGRRHPYGEDKPRATSDGEEIW